MEFGGRDATLKTVYSNGVTAAQSQLVKQHVIAKLNFTKVATKTTVSVHMKNKDLNTSLVVAFNRSGCVTQQLAHESAQVEVLSAWYAAVHLFRPQQSDCDAFLGNPFFFLIMKHLAMHVGISMLHPACHQALSPFSPSAVRSSV